MESMVASTIGLVAVISSTLQQRHRHKPLPLTLTSGRLTTGDNININEHRGSLQESSFVALFHQIVDFSNIIVEYQELFCVL